MSVKLHEYTDDEEFYARFIHVRGPQHSVLVFNYDDGARDLAERIAGLMDDEWTWHEGDARSWDAQEENGDTMKNMQQNPDTNEWEPAVPLALYISRWFGLIKRYGCVCRAEFTSEKVYEDHYRGWHLGVGDGETG